MESSHGILSSCVPCLTEKENRTNRDCSLSKVALIGLGVILIIGGALAAWLSYAHVGPYSFSCLAAIPLGIALIVASVCCIKARVTHLPPKNPKEQINVFTKDASPTLGKNIDDPQQQIDTPKNITSPGEEPK